METENSLLQTEENEEESLSVLGTKNFWDQQYVTELENFKDHGDIGEIWFGKKVMDSIVKWTTDKFEKNINILDLGCGNGVLLIQLAQKGFENLVGVDYSESAIVLANAIAESRQANISYKTIDVLSEGAVDSEDHGKYNLLLDKGTFDAISLMEDFGSAVCERYLKATSSMLKEDGLFLMATCNWTIDEIVQHMATYYSRTEVIPTPSMQFGGQQGNKVSVVVFRKNS
ncbi:EEF1A lysine methyltransferase 2-like [Daphnia carinata]|uniref:EEF1A lysine methyltransferase 2-like n=1 Tax=Daphnia carinata TaxID=120202 RepID=UPI00257BEC34|nr:EEF1A lysine methyltransferase 2-like [Daphnia carinata]XP_057375142.1 EEF1A lysine methyltransferase 2-like [Daphnia carinata]